MMIERVQSVLRKLMLGLALVGGCFALTGCETVQGAGEDIQGTSERVEEEIED